MLFHVPLAGFASKGLAATTVAPQTSNFVNYHDLGNFPGSKNSGCPSHEFLGLLKTIVFIFLFRTQIGVNKIVFKTS